MASPTTLVFTANDDARTERDLVESVKKIKSTKHITRLCGDKDPTSHWKCKAMCDPDVCRVAWAGSFTLDD